MLTTPLQLAVATMALANRGRFYRPQLVGEGGVQGRSPEPLPPAAVAREHYWQVMVDTMVAVVHGRRGTARGIGSDAPYRIAGKTGTSQVIGIAQDGRYDREQIELRNRDHALFISFAPAEAPSIADEQGVVPIAPPNLLPAKIGRAHGGTPVTGPARMP